MLKSIYHHICVVIEKGLVPKEQVSCYEKNEKNILGIKRYIGAVLLDLDALNHDAFDALNHDLLLAKLHIYVFYWKSLFN